MSEESADKSTFSNLVQIGIVVKDIGETIKCLTSYGIGPFEHRAVPAGAKEYYKGKPMDATFKIVAVNVGGVELEFIQPVFPSLQYRGDFCISLYNRGRILSGIYQTHQTRYSQ